MIFLFFILIYTYGHSLTGAFSVNNTRCHSLYRSQSPKRPPRRRRRGLCRFSYILRPALLVTGRRRHGSHAQPRVIPSSDLYLVPFSRSPPIFGGDGIVNHVLGCRKRSPRVCLRSLLKTWRRASASQECDREQDPQDSQGSWVCTGYAGGFVPPDLEGSVHQEALGEEQEGQRRQVQTDPSREQDPLPGPSLQEDKEALCNLEIRLRHCKHSRGLGFDHSMKFHYGILGEDKLSGALKLCFDEL
ncbi:unnamed protein product [Musa acuminata subsp. malaccensis]|uniref:(wild Malaysian banana) hypothetical protein n=1 Tax=Musa acuminata subsp. malaccensis TaxID=214687 RepID=A0A804HTI4_MUSAM|nr:unnamed protein product [Musa acuminata subsp. malaccensis]